MKKISYKKLLVILGLVMLIFSISTVSFASLVEMNPQIGPGGEQVKGIAEQILGIIQVIAAAVAAIMLVVIAIKYITAAPSEKADLKKTMGIYVAGVLILFAGSAILGIIQSAANDINNGGPKDKGSSAPETVQT